jgi:hypothetical protein
MPFAAEPALVLPEDRSNRSRAGSFPFRQSDPGNLTMAEQADLQILLLKSLKIVAETARG